MRGCPAREERPALRPTITKHLGCSLLLALAVAASSAQAASWRRIAALEEISVVTCAGDQRLSWIVRSQQEQRALFTPEFHKACPSGTLIQRIWPCCGSGGHQVVHSREQLERILATMAARPHAALSLETRNAYLGDVDRLVPDFQKEALVLFAVPYGPTGNARASLHATEREGVLGVRIRVEVPPPPRTPNTVTFYFVLAIDRSRIRELELVTESPAETDLGVVHRTSAARRISLLP